MAKKVSYMEQMSSKRGFRPFRRAFTLIELLVVISIIAVLLSISLPSLRKAKAAAMKTVCGSNLHQWGLAFAAYSADNNNKVPHTAQIWGRRFPNAVLTDRVDPLAFPGDVNKAGMLSVHLMKSYMAGADIKYDGSGDIRGMEINKSAWFCPASRRTTGFYNGVIQQYRYFHIPYTYFAGIRTWGGSQPDPGPLYRDLTDNIMGQSTKLLMSDYLYNSVYWWPPESGWGYNHGMNGSSCMATFYGRGLDQGPPRITGTNQLFGDNHVEWKGRAMFDIGEMLDPRVCDTVPWVKCSPTIWVTY